MPPLQEWEGWGEKSAANLFAAIDRSRTISLERFIYALGIRQVGQATARLLARQYGTFAAWNLAMTRAADERARNEEEMKKPELVGEAYADLCAIDQVGVGVADDLARFFRHAENRQMVQDLCDHLTRIEDAESWKVAPQSAEKQLCSLAPWKP